MLDCSLLSDAFLALDKSTARIIQYHQSPIYHVAGVFFSAKGILQNPYTLFNRLCFIYYLKLYSISVFTGLQFSVCCDASPKIFELLLLLITEH